MHALCPQLLPYTHVVMVIRVSFFLGEHVLSASRGVHQGGSLGPLLFFRAIHPILLSLQSMYSDVFQEWYVDDENVVGVTKNMQGLNHTIIREGPDFGISLNLHKTHLLWPSLTQGGR